MVVATSRGLHGGLAERTLCGVTVRRGLEEGGEGGGQVGVNGDNSSCIDLGSKLRS